MTLRRQLPVASPISIAAVASAFARSLGDADAIRRRASALLRDRFSARHVAVTDSGTSALVAALRLGAPAGGTVGLPAYACVDLAAAAIKAGVRVRLYDVDPRTLSPDLDSVQRMLERGVDAVVVAHLFGFPADVPGVRALAAARGVTVIEDAAQAAGGGLGGNRLGSLGDLTVLSFGRGKGLCAGGGGALLVHEASFASGLAELRFERSGRGWSGLVKTAVQFALGRPSLYGVPASVPWLRLGEMVYHDAGEPALLSSASALLLESALELEGPDVARRRQNADVYDRLVAASSNIERPSTIPGGAPSYLRYPVVDGGSRRSAAELGVLQPYPATLAESRELAAMLDQGEPPTPGAALLRDRLFTFPTHGFVRERDHSAIAVWLSAIAGVADRAERDLTGVRTQA